MKRCKLCADRRRVLNFGSGLYATEKPCPLCGDPQGPVLNTVVSAVREAGER